MFLYLYLFASYSQFVFYKCIVIIKENQSEGDTQKPLYINLYYIFAQGKNDSITRLNDKNSCSNNAE